MSKVDVVSANLGWKLLEGDLVISVCEDAVVAWGIESSLKQSGREYMFSPVAITSTATLIQSRNMQSNLPMEKYAFLMAILLKIELIF